MEDAFLKHAAVQQLLKKRMVTFNEHTQLLHCILPPGLR